MEFFKAKQLSPVVILIPLSIQMTCTSFKKARLQLA